MVLAPPLATAAAMQTRNQPRSLAACWHSTTAVHKGHMLRPWYVCASAHADLYLILYVHARSARGCFHISGACMARVLLYPKTVIIRLALSIAEPQAKTYNALCRYCAGSRGDPICGFAQAFNSGPDCILLQCACSISSVLLC